MNAQSDQIKGHAKSVAGIVTGDDELKARGDTETKTAETVGRIDAAKDKAGDVLDAAKDKLDDIAEAAKKSVHRE